MSLLYPLLAVSLLLLGSAQTVLAVQPLGHVSPGPGHAATTGLIERGGTIEVIDPVKDVMVVDGVIHRFSAARVKIHFPPSPTNAKTLALKVGMQIRFQTSVDAVSGQSQIREIWVTSADDHRLQR